MLLNPFIGTVGVGSGGGQTFLVDENCEGTGTPANWTDTGAVNWDYTANIINGAHSLQIPVSTGTEYASYTGQANVYAKMRLRIITVDSSGSFHVVLGIYGGGNLLAAAMMAQDSGTNSLFRLFTNNNNSGSSAVDIPASANWYVWVDFLGSGTCVAAASASNSKPTSDGSGVCFVTATGSNATATNLKIGSPSTSGEFVVDDIQVSATAIA